ncbi:MAG: 5'-nucleotidase C-terminal domain-containing protein [Syntrophobacteraceae bacterium]
MKENRMRMAGAFVTLLILAIMLASGAALAGPASNLKVKLLAINDFHGQLSPKTVSSRPAGGAAVLASYLEAAQAGMEDRSIIISAGDFVGASPANSALLQDEPSIMFLNALANAYCSNRMNPRCNMVATVGNHEFDEGVDELERLIYGGNYADGPYLENPYSGAHFPYVAANVIVTATGETLLPPYVIKTVRNTPIAFIGAVLKDTPSIVAPAGVAGLAFLDEADAINSYIPAIKAKGVKAIVAIIHQGGADVSSIVSRLDGEVDVVISGHTHAYTDSTVNNAAGNPVLVTQAYSAGTAFADITLEISPYTKDIVTKSAVITTTWGDAGAGLTPDGEVASIVAEADNAVADAVNVVIGQAAGDITRTQNAAGESALGNLIADGQRLYEGTDFAFMNPGGIRADIYAGNVTWGALFTVQPFGNQMVRMTMTGQQIYDVLAQQWATPASPKMLQISGLTYFWTYNGSGVAGTITSVLKDGVPIDKSATYTVTTNNFLAGGGDNFTVFKSGLDQVVDAADIDVLVSYVKGLSQPFNAAIEGRITRLVPPAINGPAVNVRYIRALSQPFTIAALPDTQFYAEDELIEFNKQIDWVLANAASENIVFVTHLGDVVDNGSDSAQWAFAMNALTPLLQQEELPFSIVRGNHDDPTYFLKNIKLATTLTKSWTVAASPSGLTQAQLFTVQGAQFLHIGFQKDPADDELAWANDLLAESKMQGLPVIVSTHDYINGSGRSATGKIMWEKFVKDNPMVFMVLNGHTHTEYALVSHDEANRPVYQMLSDYQDRDFGGQGLMRLITIDPAQSKILVKTFSPYYEVKGQEVNTNYYETDADSQFEYDINILERLAYDTAYDFGAEPPAPALPELVGMPSDLHYSHIFQNRRPMVGTLTDYEDTVDTQINENNANLDYDGEATLTTDMDDNGARVNAFLRFDDVIGYEQGQIPPGSTIKSATLVFNVTSSTKGQVKMHRMLVPWSEHSTWMDFTPVDAITGLPSYGSFTYYDTEEEQDVTMPSVMVGGGVQADDAEAMSAVDAVFTCKKPIPTPFVVPGSTGVMSADITTAVQAWVDGQTNHGWFFEPTSGDGWDFQTAEGKQPPALLIEVEGAELVQ